MERARKKRFEKVSTAELVETAKQCVENIDCARAIRDCAIEQSKILMAQHKKAIKVAADCLKDIQDNQRKLAEIGKLLQGQGV